MRFGYGRISTFRPLEGQRPQLLKENCYKTLFEDARAPEQKVLDEVVYSLAGPSSSDRHTLVVCSLDRLAPSLTRLFAIINALHDKKIQLLVLDKNWFVMGDHFDPVLRVYDLIAFSRNIAAEKSKLALETADEKGSLIGRPRKLDKKLLKKIEKQLRNGSNATTLATEYEVSVATLYRNLARLKL